MTKSSIGLGLVGKTANVDPSYWEDDMMIWVSLVLAISMLAVIIGGLWNRISGKLGIGWQFIRYTVIAIGIPTVALLALNNALSGEAATLIAGAMGFAFGKTGKDS